MMDSGDELRILLEQVAELPYGQGQVSRVEEVIRRADALGDRRLMFDARMLGSVAYTFGGEPAKAFVTFAWCIAEFDRASSSFTSWDDAQLRWQYKWIIKALRDFPEVSLERTKALLDDMERRYRLGGHSLHSVYTLRWRLARHIGDTDAADRWFEAWCTAQRDANSDCEGCDPTSKVEHLVDRHKDEEAIVLAEPVLANRVTCHQQPHRMLTELMVPYLRTGQLERARDAHVRGYRGFRDHIADLSEVSRHIEFCGLTGNEARGLELIERHLDWFDRAPSPRSAMNFAVASAFVLSRVASAGRGELTVYRRATADRTAGNVTVERLHEEFVAFARALAARFDERNGTSACGDEVERRLAAEPLVEYLPLSAVARASALRATSGQDGSDAETSGSDPSRSGTFLSGSSPSVAPGVAARRARLKQASADVRTSLPADLPDPVLIDLLEDALGSLDDEYRAIALWEVFEERSGALAALNDWDRSRACDASARIRVIRDRDHAAAEKPFREAIELYRRCGDEERARITETWLGRSLARIHEDAVTEADLLGDDESTTGEAELAVALIEEALAWLREHGRHHEPVLSRCELKLVEALNVVGRIEDALVAAERAQEARSFDPSQIIGTRIALLRAFCLLRLGRFDEVADVTRQVCERAGDLGRPDLEGIASACLGHALEGLGDYAGAVDAFDVTLRTGDDDVMIGQIRAERAHLLANSSRAAEVVDELVEIVADLIAHGDDTAAAVAQFDLAVAYHAAGALYDAAETGETAVRALGAAGMHTVADHCRYRLVQVYADLDEADQALMVLDELIARLNGYDNLSARGQMQEEAGRLLFRIDRDAAAAVRFEAAMECYQSADLPYDAARVVRARAVSLSWTSDPDAGMAALAKAERVIASLPEGEEATAYEQAMLDVDAAQVLANSDQLSDAVDRLASVPARLRTIGAFGEALGAELSQARLLLGLGRIQLGEKVLRSVIAGSPHDTAVHRSAVWTLIAVLEETGRRGDAATLRDVYGLPEGGYDDEESDE